VSLGLSVKLEYSTTLTHTLTLTLFLKW
jgi:hypothetical protein